MLKRNARIDPERVRKTRYIHEWDRSVDVNGMDLNTMIADQSSEVQCACWGYPTEGAYYRDASSTEPLLGIKIPFFAIHAEDDPVSLVTIYMNICLNKAGGAERSTSVPGSPANTMCCPVYYIIRRTSLVVRAWRRTVVCQACEYDKIDSGETWANKSLHQTVNFLRKMAEDVDLEALQHELSASSTRDDTASDRPVFQPLRRKMELAR